MMKRAEAEAGIRDLATKWAKETGYKPRQGHYPSFSAFRSWVELQHYGNYFNFRSTASAAHDAEQWFEDEIKRWSKRFVRDQACTPEALTNDVQPKAKRSTGR